MNETTDKTTHTPGPWHIEVFEGEPDRPFICASWGQQDPVVNEISELGNKWANARLLAAAPDLLAACELMESVYRQNVVAPGEPSSVLVALQSAIAKARGS